MDSGQPLIFAQIHHKLNFCQIHIRQRYMIIHTNWIWLKCLVSKLNIDIPLKVRNCISGPRGLLLLESKYILVNGDILTISFLTVYSL